MIHFHEVQKSVGKQQILTNLTLFLPKASYTLVQGDKQSGKTTLVRMIMGYEKPDQGSLQVDEIDIGSISGKRIPYLRRQIGLIAETPALLEEQTVLENISVPLQLAGFDRDVITQRLHAMLDLTGLGDEQQKKANELNSSQRQLVSAARATIHKPKIVLAEEPLQQLENDITRKVVELLNKANESGTTILATIRNHSEFTDGINSTAQTMTLEDGTIKYNEQDTIN